MSTLVLVAGKDPAEEPGGGHSGYVRAHARAARAAGFDPILLCVGHTARTYESDVGTVHRLRTPYRPVRQLAIAGHGRVLARGLVDLVADRPGPVLVHAFGVWGVGAVAGRDRLRAQGRDVRVGLSSYTTYQVEHASLVRGAVDDPLLQRARYRLQALWVAAAVERQERWAYRRADAVWVNYDAVARIIAERHGAEVAVQRIGYGPESGFDPLPGPEPVPDEVLALADPGAPLVVSIARHHSRKGVDVLIDALALLRDRGVPFRACLVGYGPLLDAHRRRVADLGLTGAVAVPGGVPRIAPYLGAAEVFALPSREEQSGALAILDAQRLGLPVVSTNVDGIPEDVTDGETGLLVPPGDAPALADALARVLADPALRARLGTAGQARFAERFAPEPFTAALAAAYATVGFPPPT